MESYNQAKGFSLDKPKFGRIRIQKQPEVLSIFAVGVEKILGNSVEVAYWRTPFTTLALIFSPRKNSHPSPQKRK